jgi:hypothetical protein
MIIKDRTQMKSCIYCNSTNIQPDILLDQNTEEPGGLGLKYRAKIFDHVEPIYAELCKDCGSIIRLYIKNTERNWHSK